MDKSKRMLTDLLEKDMSRKEFLIHVGGVALAVVGVTGLMRKLADPFGKQQRPAPEAAAGYGHSPYGGSTEPGKRKA
jgi:hypothetical protein